MLWWKQETTANHSRRLIRNTTSNCEPVATESAVKSAVVLCRVVVNWTPFLVAQSVLFFFRWSLKGNNSQIGFTQHNKTTHIWTRWDNLQDRPQGVKYPRFLKPLLRSEEAFCMKAESSLSYQERRLVSSNLALTDHNLLAISTALKAFCE